MSTRIRSFEDLDAMKGRVDHVLTLFSGGLDSSYVLKELSQRKLRTTALSVDLGEGCQIEDLKEIADFFGVDLTIVDAREMFAHEAVAPAIVSLIAHLNITVGEYSIGRYSGLEHLEGGQKVLEVREAPAATILMDAYRHIETAVLDAELLREKVALELLWTREAVEGRWFAPLRECADAFIRVSSEKVTGTAGYSLRQGAMDLCSIKAHEPLYLADRDAWEKTLSNDTFAPPARKCRAISEEEVTA